MHILLQRTLLIRLGKFHMPDSYEFSFITTGSWRIFAKNPLVPITIGFEYSMQIAITNYFFSINSCSPCQTEYETLRCWRIVIPVTFSLFTSSFNLALLLKYGQIDHRNPQKSTRLHISTRNPEMTYLKKDKLAKETFSVEWRSRETEFNHVYSHILNPGFTFSLSHGIPSRHDAAALWPLHHVRVNPVISVCSNCAC